MLEYEYRITSEEYMSLRKKVGWCEFPLEEAQAGIDNAYFVYCARDDGKAVGVVRLLWDGGYIAYLSDVIVDPEYQRQGIGKKLVESCISRIKADAKPGYKVKMCLLSAKGKEPFYQKFGFEERPNDRLGPGMDQWIELEMDHGNQCAPEGGFKPDRIIRMENILDKAARRMDALEKSIAEFEAVQDEIGRLEAYYASDQWKEDFLTDEAGEYSDSLKRGVLSEDGIYNMLERNRELLEKIKENLDLK